MGFGSLEYPKIEYAKTLAATFAYYLGLQRDSVGLMTFDNEIGEFVSARSRAGQMRQVLIALSRPVQGIGTDLGKPLQQIAALVRRRGLIVLISDMLASIDTLRTNLAYLRSRGHEVLILRTLDPAEIELQISQPSMVVDLETGKEIYLDPEQAKESYRQRFDEHQAELLSICNSLGVDLFQVSTDQPLDHSLAHLVITQRNKSRHTTHAGMISRATQYGAGT